MIFGMEMTETGLQFAPMIPSGLVNGNVYLNHFNYRNATLDIVVKGTGNKVRSLKLNGEEQALPYEFPANQSGRFNIEIEMMMDTNVPNEINLVEAGPGKCWSPLEPVLTGQENKPNWNQDPDLSYSIYGVNTIELASSPFDLSTKKMVSTVFLQPTIKDFNRTCPIPSFTLHILLFMRQRMLYTKEKPGSLLLSLTGNM